MSGARATAGTPTGFVGEREGSLDNDRNELPGPAPAITNSPASQDRQRVSQNGQEAARHADDRLVRMPGLSQCGSLRKIDIGFAEWPLKCELNHDYGSGVMHRKYIGSRLGRDSGLYSPAAVAGCGRSLRRGFSLVEMLVVIAIIFVLIGASNVLFRIPVSRAGEPATRMLRGIEMARAKAVASNRSVAIRFEKQAEGSRELVMRYLWARPGQTASKLKELEFRRAERFQDIMISKDVEIPNGKNSSDPTAGSLPVRQLEPGESLVMTPDGQMLHGKESSGNAFPVPSDQLEPVIAIGIQPTIGGRVVDSVRRDVAIVQIQCASGTARVIQP